MGIRQFIGWVGSWIFSNSAQQSGGMNGDDTPEDSTIYDEDDQSIFVPTSSFDKELEHDDDQPENKKRKATHESLVIYDPDRGSSSAANSQPDLGWLLSNDPAVCHMDEALKCKLRSLYARAVDVSTELKHHEIQPKKKPRMEVHQWLTDVSRIRDEAPNIATDGKSIQNFTSRVEELLQRGNFPHGYVLPDDSPIELPLPAKNPAGKMFELNTATILDWLKNNERCIIGVYGMGGVGKTTVLRWLYNEVLKQKDHFGHPYWATVSQNCSKLKLQNDIAKELGVNLSGEGDDDRKRAAILNKRLSTMGPTVLFLDDMWEWNPFLGMDIEFPIEGSSCKIILSSRLYKVCKEMGCKGFVINAKVLPEYEAWNLFVDKLGHYDTLIEEAKGIARLIAKECGGLPLAIATMARSMSEVVDVRVWNDALNELRQSACVQGDMEEYVFSVLKYSYNHLNDRMLQNCFLSCVLYPEDYMIPREELIDGWIMEGLLDDVGSRSNQVNKGHTILNKLINSCLLEACTDYDRSKGIKMHDLMRDLAIMITNGNPCFMAKSGLGLPKVPEEEQWSKDLVKVSLSYNYIKEIPNGMAPFTPQLTVLLLNDNPLSGIPESFFIHMRALTVLDLSHADIERLPESVSDLENLRALLLAYCTRLRYVPCLAKLPKLRVLDLFKDYNLEKAPEGIERLKCLEKVTYCPWDTSDSTRFNNLIQSSLSLSCYKFLLCDDAVSYTNIWENDFFSMNENLVCVGESEIGDDKTSYLLPATIQNLQILKCAVKRRSLGDVFPTLGLATDLRELHVKKCKELRYILSSSSSLGPQLEDMYLNNLPDLRGIIEFGGFTFSHLLSLEIKNCPKIKVIFPHSEKQLSLPNLKYFTVSDCEELEEIFELNKNPTIGLPELVILQLKCLPKLRRLCMNLHLCTSLKNITISECEELEEIFESNNGHHLNSTFGLLELVILKLKCLPKLRRLCINLIICECEELEEIFEIGGRSSEAETLVVDPINIVCNPQPSSYPVSFLPKLKVIRLEYLPKLGSIYKDLHLCTFLEELEVVNCPKIERIFGSPKPILTLCKLRKLKLQGLPMLSSIHRGLLFCTSLKEFSIEGCIKLKMVPLSDHLICDNTPSSLLSLPSDSDNPELWELLRRDYSEDARLLSDFIQYHVQLQQHNHHQNQLNLENDARNLLDNIDQVSVPASLIPDADADTDADVDKKNWLEDQLLLPRLVVTEDEQYQIRSWGETLSLS